MAHKKRSRRKMSAAARSKASKVMKEAAKLRKKGKSRAAALREAWRTV